MLYRYTKQRKMYIINNELRYEIINFGALKMLRNHQSFINKMFSERNTFSVY
jgi:hypothetical protein